MARWEAANYSSLMLPSTRHLVPTLLTLALMPAACGDSDPNSGTGAGGPSSSGSGGGTTSGSSTGGGQSTSGTGAGGIGTGGGAIGGGGNGGTGGSGTGGSGGSGGSGGMGTGGGGMGVGGCPTGNIPTTNIGFSDNFGTGSNDRAYAITTDTPGNVLIAGITAGALGNPVLGSDAFVRSYSNTGVENWTYQFGTLSTDSINGVTTDFFNNVIVAGLTAYQLPGQTHAGAFDGFVVKLDILGDPIWTVQFGTVEDDYIYDAEVDDSDMLENIVVSGHTVGDLDGMNNGSDDAFVRKVSGVDGSPLWTTQFGTMDVERGYGVAVDGSGNVVVAGWTTGNLEGISAGGDEAFVVKLDSGGVEQWARQIGTAADERAQDVAVDPSGNILVAGWSTGTLACNAASGAWVRKYDPSGNELWTHQFDSSKALGVATDSNGNVLITGEVFLQAGNGLDAFVRKLTPDGSVLWHHNTVITMASDRGTRVTADGAGNVWMAGYNGPLSNTGPLIVKLDP
jgi:Beta-propeller repeat